MKKILGRHATAFFLVVAAAPAFAHHSTAIYDLDRDLSLRGVVRKLEWTSPHVYIQIATRDGAGKESLWLIEAGTPNVMSRNGWSPESLAPGEEVVVAAHPSRNAERSMALGDFVRKADGTVLGMSQSSLISGLSTPETTAVFTAESISGHWITEFDPELLGKFLRPAASWELTDEGRAAVASYDSASAVNPAKDCVLETCRYLDD